MMSALASTRKCEEPPQDRGRRLAVSGLLTGSAIFFVSATVVNVGNYAFNLVLGRWMGPAMFSEVSLIVTLMLMVTLATTTLQTTIAKFTASYAADEDSEATAAIRHWFVKLAWILGTVVAAGLIFGAPSLQEFFHTQSPWPFILLGIGVPVYFAQGVDRGVLQGGMRFGVLALSFQAEMWSRLLAGVLLVGAGFAVSGAVGALTISFIATWLVARRARIGLPKRVPLAATERKNALVFAAPVTVALIGQILINNSDVLIVKHFFPPETAGQYAALALIGRVVFFATWSVVTVLVPLAAREQQKQNGHWHLMWLSLGMVGVVSVGIIGASLLFGTEIVGLLFGSEYLAVVPLLWIYALATGLFAMVNVIVTYRLSVGNVRVSVFGIIGGVAQVILLWVFHANLYQVVIVQVYLMGALFTCLLGWELWMHRREVVAQRRRSELSLRLKSVPNV